MSSRLTLIGLCVILLFAPLAIGNELLDAKRVFSGDADVYLSDGSSMYMFQRDGQFTLEPLGMSGRTIEGQWKYADNFLHITGIWSWANGISPTNDRREMDIYVGWISSKTDEYNSSFSGKTYKIPQAYFLIERLEKQK